MSEQKPAERTTSDIAEEMVANIGNDDDGADGLRVRKIKEALDAERQRTREAEQRVLELEENRDDWMSHANDFATKLGSLRRVDEGESMKEHLDAIRNALRECERCPKIQRRRL